MIMKNLLYILLSVITLVLAGCSTTDNKKEAGTAVVVEDTDAKETELSTYESENVETAKPTENETKEEETKDTETKAPTEEHTTQTEEPASTQEETVKEEPTETPTERPTQQPTEAPTEAPTEIPTEAATEEPTTETPTQPPVQEPEFVAYNPYNVAQMANAKVKAAGKVLLPENLDRLLAEGAITQEEYNEYYPYDGCGYYSVFIETNLLIAQDIVGTPLRSEEAIAEHIAGMLVLETGPYVYVECNGVYNHNGTDFYEFRCYR